MKKYSYWFLFVAALLSTVAAGRWAMGLILVSEYVHFSANFPTYEGAPVMALDDLGGPWTRLPDEEWPGYPPGGMMVWGREGAVVVDIGKQSFLKHAAQPWEITLATYWIRNVGTTPRKIRLDLDMCGAPLEWVTFEREWDQATQTTTRDIPPGTTFAMDWHIHVPENRRGLETICQGGLNIFDARTGRLLTHLPIEIINSKAGRGAARGAE